MSDPHEEEYDACTNTKRAPDPIANLGKVGCNSATGDAVAEKEHEIAGPAVQLSDIVDFVALGPRLFAFVPTHHSRCQGAGDADKKSQDESEQAEERVRVDRLLPVYVGIDFERGVHGCCDDEKAQDVVRVPH